MSVSRNAHVSLVRGRKTRPGKKVLCHTANSRDNDRDIVRCIFKLALANGTKERIKVCV